MIEKRKRHNDDEFVTQGGYTEDVDSPDDNRKRDRPVGKFIIFGLLSVVMFFCLILYEKQQRDLHHKGLDVPEVFRPRVHSAVSIPDKHEFDAVTTRQLENPQKAPEEKKLVEALTHDASQQVVDSDELEKTVTEKLEEIREMKRNHVVLETDEKAQAKIHAVQDLLRHLLKIRYGPEPYHVEMTLRFPESMPDYATAGPTGKIYFELGPAELVPYSVYYFLEIVRNWKGGAFHRWAGHVLQARVSWATKGLAFQEYNPGFPHKKLTMGYAGRPGGPAFYISTVDNTHNHGPASQGSKTEADGCFGKILGGGEVEAVVNRMKLQPGAQKPNGFVSPASNHIAIESVRLLSPGESYVL